MAKLIKKNQTDLEKWVPPDIVEDELVDTTHLNDIFEETDHQGHIEPIGNITSEKVAEIVEAAKKDAYREGLQAGVQKAQQSQETQFQKTWQARIQELEKILAAFSHPYAIIDDKVEEHILQLVIKLTTHLFRHELTTKPEQIMTMVKEAKALLPHHVTDIEISVNPEDAKLIRQLSDNIADEEISRLLTEDQSLNRGDCRVASDTTQVDATLDARIQTIIETGLRHAN